MFRISLYFLVVACLCLICADIEIVSGSPWSEFSRMSRGILVPDLLSILNYKVALFNTLTFAFSGLALGVFGGIVMSFLFQFTLIRLFCSFLRSIHEIFWAFLFLPLVGLNPVCGVLAIGVPYMGIFAKVYAEIRQEANLGVNTSISEQSSSLAYFFYAELPQIYATIKSYTSYRLECALRSSAVLGFIGLPTLGFHLETAFREGLYSEAAALLYAFYLLIASLKFWVKPKFIIAYVVTSLFLVFKDFAMSWSNMQRFITYDILPWPIRRAGVLNGTSEIDFAPVELFYWFTDLLKDEAVTGILNTVILTQIVLVGSGLFALILFGFASRHFGSSVSRRFTQFILIILRTTPEFILAYMLLQLWGPSMLPAIGAIVLHNGSILAYLLGQKADQTEIRFDAAKNKLNKYFFEVLPRVYGQFLAYLFLRWEIMMRESAILGILGIATLGFYIDSAVAEQKLDKVMILIFITALLNMLIDNCSQRIRKKFHYKQFSCFNK